MPRRRDRLPHGTRVSRSACAGALACTAVVASEAAVALAAASGAMAHPPQLASRAPRLGALRASRIAVRGDPRSHITELERARVVVKGRAVVKR